MRREYIKSKSYIEWLKNLGCLVYLPLSADGDLEDRISGLSLQLTGQGSLVWDGIYGNRRIYALLGTTDSQQTTVFDYVCGSGYSRVEISAIPINTIIDVFEDFNSVIINGATYSLTKYNNSRTNMVMLMGSWMGSGANDHPMGDGQYHLFEIWDANNVLKLQGIPAFRIADNKPGLYDIVNNQFYTNAGTGEFLYN